MKVNDHYHDLFEREQDLRQQMKETVRNQGELQDIEREIDYEERSDIDDGFKRFLSSVGYY